MSLAVLFQHLLLSMFRMLVHPSSGACDLLWIYFMGCILPEDGLIRPKHVGVLIILISECFKVYFSAKSWLFKI